MHKRPKMTIPSLLPSVDFLRDAAPQQRRLRTRPHDDQDDARSVDKDETIFLTLFRLSSRILSLLILW